MPKESITNDTHRPDVVRTVTFWGKILVFCFLGSLTTLFFLTCRNPLFWDSILLSGQYGNFYFAHWGKELFVPSEIAGYPPLWGYYLATVWKLLGRTLFASHLAMIPFLLLLVCQVKRATVRWIPEPWKSWVWVLVLLEPVWLAQSTQVAPDLALIALFWLILNDLNDGKYGRAGWFLSALMLLSPRGLLAGLALVLFGLMNENQNDRKSLFGRFVPFLLPIALAAGWYFFHKVHFGWTGFNTTNDWGGLFFFVSVKGFLWNGMVLIWRFLDQGRVFVLLVLVCALWEKRHFIAIPSGPVRILPAFALFFFPAFLLFENGTGHRYLLPITTVLLFFTGQIISTLDRKKAVAGFTLGFVALLSGHFWIYPEPIAKGWDATLAHLPYFSLKEEARTYLADESTGSVGSDFPNLRPPVEEYLGTESQTIFKPKSLNTDKTVLYSNLFNGFTQADMDTLGRDFRLEKEWHSGQINMAVYRRK